MAFLSSDVPQHIIGIPFRNTQLTGSLSGVPFSADEIHRPVTPAAGASVPNPPGPYESLVAAYKTCQEEVRALGEELIEVKRSPPPSLETDYWRREALHLLAQLDGLHAYAASDAMRWQAEVVRTRALAGGEVLKARQKAAFVEVMAQQTAHHDAEAVFAKRERRTHADEAWLREKVLSHEEHSQRLAAIVQHRSSVASAELEALREGTAQLAMHRDRISLDEVRISSLKTSNERLTNSLQNHEVCEAKSATRMEETTEDIARMKQQLCDAGRRLARLEEREKADADYYELRIKALEDANCPLQLRLGEIQERESAYEALAPPLEEACAQLTQKIRGAEARRARLATLEADNKQFRLRLRNLDDHTAELVLLRERNKRLERQLRDAQHKNTHLHEAATQLNDVAGPSQSSDLRAQILEGHNDELHAELLEATCLLERVGSEVAAATNRPTQVTAIGVPLFRPGVRPLAATAMADPLSDGDNREVQVCSGQSGQQQQACWTSAELHVAPALRRPAPGPTSRHAHSGVPSRTATQRRIAAALRERGSERASSRR